VLVVAATLPSQPVVVVTPKVEREWWWQPFAAASGGGGNLKVELSGEPLRRSAVVVTRSCG